MPHEERERQSISWLAESVRSITRFASRRPRFTLWAVAIASCLCLGVTVTKMEFSTKRSDLIDPTADFQKHWLEYTKNFGDASDVVVVVEADDTTTIKRTLDELGSRLAGETELFSNVLYKFETGRWRSKGLQFLSPQQLQQGLRSAQQALPVLQGNSQSLRLDAQFASIGRQIQAASARSASNELPPLYHQADLLATSIEAYLANPNDFRPPWPTLLEDNPRFRDDVEYFLNDAGTMGYLKAAPTIAEGLDGLSKPIDRLHEIIADVKVLQPAAKIGVTGIPVLENDEMRRSQIDMALASAISLIGVCLVLVVGFRGLRHPMLALIMLAVGLIWSFGYTTYAIGHLNTLSISSAAILIGLGIAFAIHYLNKYLELRHEGRLLRPALHETSSAIGSGLIADAATTAIAFFCVLLTEFRGVAELGAIAGGGILLCALATFVVLPALVALADKDADVKKLPTPFEGKSVRWLTSRYPVLTAVVALAVVLGVGSRAFHFEKTGVSWRVGYDYNLLNLQAKGVESVDLQQKIFDATDHSLLYAVSVADTQQEARDLKARFEMLPSVHHVEDLASRLPAYSLEQTRRYVEAFRAPLSRLPSQAPAFARSNPTAVGRSVEQLYTQLRGSKNPSASSAAYSLNAFLDRFEAMPLASQVTFLDSYQKRVAETFLRQFNQMAAATSTQPVTMADLPPGLTPRFLSKQGKWLLQIYPNQQIWDEQPLAQFVADVRSVDAEATGTPLQNYEAARQIKNSYQKATLYALAAIFVVLLIDLLDKKYRFWTLIPPLAVTLLVYWFTKQRGMNIDPVWFALAYAGVVASIAAIVDLRDFRDACLALVTPLAGGLLMFGILGWIGIDLNPANLIVLPLLLGIGVDNGVYVLHNFRSQAGQGKFRISGSTTNAIVMTSLTTIVGFGSMMVAGHRGLFSVGVVLSIGMGSCLFVSLIMLPAILTAISGRGTKAADLTVKRSAPRPQQTQKQQPRKAA